MMSFVLRVSSLSMLLLCLSVVAMRVTGQRINTIYGLGMYASVTDDERVIGEITYTDPLTQVGFTSPVLLFQRVHVEIDDAIMSLYIQDTQLSEAVFVTDFDTQFNRVDVVWNQSTYLESIYIALWDQEAITSVDMYHVNVATGEVTLFELYNITAIPNAISLIDGRILLIQTYNEVILHNLQTGEIFIDDADRSRIVGSPIHHYGHYTQFGSGNDGTNRHFIIHRETFERIELTLPDGTLIDHLHSWGGYQLLLEDMTEQLWVYDLTTLAYHRIPSEYLLYGYSGSWSNSGERLVVMRDISDYVVEIGLYTIADGSYLPVHEHLQVQNGFQTPALPRVQWSPDDSMVFVAPQYINRIIDYTLYDTITGAILYTYSGVSNSSSNKVFFWVTP